MPTAEFEQRIASLETQLAFMEDAISALDAALVAQQKQVIELGHQNRLLQQQIKEQGARLDAGEVPDNTPPPHY